MIHLLAVASLLACTSDEGSDRPTDAPATADTATTPPTEPDEALLRELLTRDFTVQDGALSSIGPDVCCGWSSCWKRNPSSDYGIYLVPPGPDESLEGRELDPLGRQFNYRLRADEAVVYIGRTPPALAYFSYRTYAHDRSDGEGGRVLTFTSLGDSINHFTIGTVEEDTFDGLMVMVTTADVGVFEAVRDAAVAAGFPSSAVNFDAIPSDLVTLGLHDEADTFRMNLRMAGFVDPPAQQAYLDAADGLVLRLTPDDGAFPPRPYEPDGFLRPGTGTDEAELEPVLEELRTAILDAHSDLAAAEPATNIREVDPDEDCWGGCNRDAAMSNTPHFTLPIDAPEEFVMVYGVNHAATGKSSFATAMVVGIFNDDSAAVVDSLEMEGSARAYLPDHPDADKLYAWTFRRDCGSDVYCTEVAAECPGLDAGELGSIHWRAYAEEATGTRPLASELVADRAIKFKPPESTTTSTK